MSLGLFLWFLWRASWPLAGDIPTEIFLRLDPLAVPLLSLAQREIILPLCPALLVLALTLALGRVFCGHICPLGGTLDLARFLGKRILPPAQAVQNAAAPKAAKPGPNPQRIKYLFLALMLGAALLGVNLAFWGSPLALVTRLYALLIHPLLLLAAEAGLKLARLLAAGINPDWPGYISVTPRHFDGLYFLLFFFGILFILERFKPRFWCRCLCPAGALLGLLSPRPLWRRSVQGCTHCGLCAGACPGAAITPDGEKTDHSACLTCQGCVRLCPGGHARFTLQSLRREMTGDAAAPPAALPGRRAFAALTGAGMLLAGARYVGGSSLALLSGRGPLPAHNLIRPPGALPEEDFLIRCLRCGQCMKVCPSNGLQPVTSLAAGVEGLFSPTLVPRHGPCEPDCHACGRVCPSFAIRGLPLQEKQWAKIGTAVILPQRCLAWAEGRSCVVCQEVCPYGAVRLMRREGGVPAPALRPERCFGCGYCERHCPVRLPAIIVEPLNALRLAGGSYQTLGREAGLNLSPGFQGEAPPPDIPPDSLPPGFTE
jgi:polyferredoxin